MLSKNKFLVGLFIIIFLTSCGQQQSNDKNANTKPTSSPSDKFTGLYDLSTPEKAVITLETELYKKSNYDLYVARSYFSPVFLDWLNRYNITEQNMNDQFVSDLQGPYSDLPPPSMVGDIKIVSINKIEDDLFKVEYSIDVNYSELDYNFGPITSFSYMRKLGNEWYIDLEPEFREHGIMNSSNGIGREKIPVGARDCGTETHEGGNSSTNINSQARDCFANAYQKCENVLFREEFKPDLTSHYSKTYWWFFENNTCGLGEFGESFNTRLGEGASLFTCTKKINIYPWNYDGATIMHQRWYSTDCLLESLFPEKYSVEHTQG